MKRIISSQYQQKKSVTVGKHIFGQASPQLPDFRPGSRCSRVRNTERPALGTQPLSAERSLDGYQDPHKLVQVGGAHRRYSRHLKGADVRPAASLFAEADLESGSSLLGDRDLQCNCEHPKVVEQDILNPAKR